MKIKAVQITKPKALFNAIRKDVHKRAAFSIKEAARLVPGFLKRNFLERGRVGDVRFIWPPISWRSLVFRTSKTRPEDINKPLIDTGFLMNSGRLEKISNFAWHVTLADYGYEHDAGIASTPDDVPVPQRKHMFISIKEDVPSLDDRFVSSFRKEAR